MSDVSLNTFVLPGICCSGYRMWWFHLHCNVLEELLLVEVVSLLRKFLASKSDVGAHGSSEVPVAEERLGAYLASQFGKLQCLAHHW